MTSPYHSNRLTIIASTHPRKNGLGICAACRNQRYDTEHERGHRDNGDGNDRVGRGRDRFDGRTYGLLHLLGSRLSKHNRDYNRGAHVMTDQPHEVVDAQAAGLHTHPHDHPHDHPEISARLDGMQERYDAWESARAAQTAAEQAANAAVAGAVASAETSAELDQAQKDIAEAQATADAATAAGAESAADDLAGASDDAEAAEDIGEEPPPEHSGPREPREPKKRGWWDSYK